MSIVFLCLEKDHASTLGEVYLHTSTFVDTGPKTDILGVVRVSASALQVEAFSGSGRLQCALESDVRTIRQLTLPPSQANGLPQRGGSLPE